MVSPGARRAAFVCSATGTQGGAVARQLLTLGWDVHSTTRNPESAAARRLGAAGVQLTCGDWDDAEALGACLAGCGALFLCLMPSFVDEGLELRQAERIIALAKAAGVRQVVSSTTLGVSYLDADDTAPEPGSLAEAHLTGKKAIEQAVSGAAFESTTMIRPAFFMANFIEPKVERYAELRDSKTWTTALTLEGRLPLVDHEDIGRLAAAALQNPDEYRGRVIVLASDLLTVQELLDELGEAAGTRGEFKAIYMTNEQLRDPTSAKTMAMSPSIMRPMSRFVDMDALTSMIPLTSFRDFLKREHMAVKQTYP